MIGTITRAELEKMGWCVVRGTKMLVMTAQQVAQLSTGSIILYNIDGVDICLRIDSEFYWLWCSKEIKGTTFDKEKVREHIRLIPC